MKTCTKCKKPKPVSEFWLDRSKKIGRQAQCKACRLLYQRQHAKARPHLNKTRYWNNRDSERQRHLIKKYGVSFKDYYRMLSEQQGVCAICGHPAPNHRFLDVDHCHTTKLVRGLLCTNCNRMLGHAGDNPDSLIRGAEYLRVSSGRTGFQLSDVL